MGKSTITMNDSRTSVLIIATPLGNTGGTIKRLILWTKYLSVYFRINIISYGINSENKKMLEAYGAVVYECTSFNRIGRVTLILPTINTIKIIKEVRPSILISTLYWSHFISCLAVRLIDLGKSPRPVHLCHIAGEPVPPDMASGKKILRAIYSIIAKIFLKCSDVIVVLSNKEADRLMKKYKVYTDKIRVIPIGVEHVDEITEYNKKKETRTFGVVSRHYPVKNIKAIIDAFADILQDGYMAELLIYGEGPESVNLRRYAGERGVSKGIHFKGWENDIDKLYEGIDVLINHSHSEGTPRSMLEAAERGVFSIARDVGGISEMIIHGASGFLVDTNEELYDSMKKIVEMKDEEMNNMASRAKQYVREKYSINIEMRQYIMLISGYTG